MKGIEKGGNFAMTPLAQGNGSLHLRCDDLLCFPKIRPLEFLWKLGLSTKLCFLSGVHGARADK